jgi:hypothetical protein
MATFYIAQTEQGNGDGASAANAKSVSWLNTSGNWANPKESGKIGPGDTVILTGTISTNWEVRASGTSGSPITVLFGTGAKMSAAVFPATGAIRVVNKDYITIDGGATGIIGGPNEDPAGINGIIENTDNGTGLGNAANSTGVSVMQGRYVTVKNLCVQNIYVRVATGDDTAEQRNKFGAGVAFIQESSRSAYNVELDNCLITHCYIAVVSDFGNGAENYHFHHYTARNCNWGGDCADRNSTSVLNNLRVHDCYFHSWTNWDGPNNQHPHHNGFFTRANNFGVVNSAQYYNLKVGPGFTNRLNNFNASTSGIYFSGRLAGPVLIYNSVFINTGTHGPPNGLITIGVRNGVTSVFHIYNNTFIGGNGAVSVNFSNEDETGENRADLTINQKNNLIYGPDLAFASLYNGLTLVSNHNLGNGLVSNPFKWSSGGSGGQISLASWQTATGQDGDFLTSDPLLTETYRLGAGSPAIGAGENLSAFFSTDADGNARPAEGAWDIGAYQFDEIPVPLAGPRAPARRLISGIFF